MKIRYQRPLHIVSVLLAATGLLLWAPSAAAESDFEKGFERELGRIAARTFVATTHAALFHASHPRHHRPHRHGSAHRAHGPRVEARFVWHTGYRSRAAHPTRIVVHREIHRTRGHRHHHGCGHGPWRARRWHH